MLGISAASGPVRHAFHPDSPASLALDRSADEVMHSIIAQHLLASELGLLESTIARISASPSSAERLMRQEISAMQAQTLADVRHLEVTLQAARCEHTAADTALQSALQVAEQLLRSAAGSLFVAQDQLLQRGGEAPRADPASIQDGSRQSWAVALTAALQHSLDSLADGAVATGAAPAAPPPAAARGEAAPPPAHGKHLVFKPTPEGLRLVQAPPLQLQPAATPINTPAPFEPHASGRRSPPPTPAGVVREQYAHGWQSAGRHSPPLTPAKAQEARALPEHPVPFQAPAPFLPSATHSEGSSARDPVNSTAPSSLGMD
ncbi:hypothetical protein AB1Y20_005353 [Prymnesium parvum]|uniref:Mediator of RNA polymerase II transcription subunit 4 n=1 Tax=Prymnesium parvum TaxID=97485 RepID=A0AB34J5Q3_PRYPA